MSPDLWSVSLPEMVTIGGLSPGSVRNVCVFGWELRAVCGGGIPRLSTLDAGAARVAMWAGRATENAKWIRVDPVAPEAAAAAADRRTAVTFTRSPGVNGC